MSSQKYFPCKLHNTDEERRGNHPTYAILSMTPNFDIESAINKVKEIPPNNIFIIINGQQAGAPGSREAIDTKFGKALCGTERIGRQQDGTGIWQGDYNIYTTYGYRSVASVLFDRYGDKDLIINIVNARYEWGKSNDNLTRAFNNFINDLVKILNAINEDAQKKLRIFIAGFSRGAMFALRLGEWLSKYTRIVVTIDPVQNKFKEKDEWDVKWGRWKESNWTIIESSRNRNINIDKYCFPILKGNSDIHYNVFQRFRGTVDPHSWPKGCAVDGAISPDFSLTGNRKNNNDRKYKKLPLIEPYNQLDILCKDHTQLPEKYREWILNISSKHFPLPPIQCIPSEGLPGSTTTITRGEQVDEWGQIEDSGFTVLFNGNRLKSVYDHENKYIKINIPEEAVPGIKNILWLNKPFKIERTQFTVTPYIEKLYGFHHDPILPGISIILSGCFPINNNNVLLDEMVIKSTFESTKMATIDIPENIKGGIKKIKIKHEKSSNNTEMTFYSNTLELIVEPYLRYCSPYRVLPGETINVFGNFPIGNNELFLNSQKISIIDLEPKNDFLLPNIICFNVPEGIEGGINTLQLTHNKKFESNTIEFIVCDCIGNRRTKELHLKDCPWVGLMSPGNKVYLSSTYDNPKENGFYDSCHWCHVRNPEKMGPSERNA